MGHRSGPARFGPFPRTGPTAGLAGMRRMKSERLYFVAGHCDLATFARKVMSGSEQGCFLRNKTSLRGNATPGYTTSKKGSLLSNNKQMQGQRYEHSPCVFTQRSIFSCLFCRCLVGLR